MMMQVMLHPLRSVSKRGLSVLASQGLTASHQPSGACSHVSGAWGNGVPLYQNQRNAMNITQSAYFSAAAAPEHPRKFVRLCSMCLLI